MSVRDEMAALFVGFLREMKLENRGIELLNKRKTQLLFYLNTTNPLDYVHGLCMWSNTDEGGCFWGDVHYKWIKLAKNRLKEIENGSPPIKYKIKQKSKLKSIW